MKRRPYTKNDKEPTLYCNNPNCDNISSKLYLVEQKVIEGLKEWLKEYKVDYNQQIKKINNNKIQSLENTIISLESEIEKENGKLLSVFNFLEEGTYTKEMFKIRSEMISKNIEKINHSIEECKLKLEQEKNIDKERKILLPKIENIIDVYDMLLTAEEKNDLLKTVLTRCDIFKNRKGY